MYAPGITLRPWTIGGVSTTEAGEPLFTRAKVTASRSLMLWGATGWRYESSPKTYTSTEGAELSGESPVTDQSGWRAEGNNIIDVSVVGSYTHTYTFKVSQFRKDAAGREIPVGEERTYANVALPTGDLSPVDVDMLIDAGTVDGVLVSVPDSLTPRMVALEEDVDALEAGGGTGGGITEASGTVTLPADGPRLLEMYTVGSATINGETFAVDTALVARRTAAGVWQVAVVDSADWRAFVAAPVPDTTAPTVPTGLSATAASSTSVNLAWSASTDAVGVTGYEYRVGGGTAVDAGAGLTETVTGLTASTLYSFEVRAYDAAGNRSGWSTAASATTSAPAGDATPPTAGTLASSAITETGFTVTVSGASDAVALHATPYAFSTNNGSTWTAWQASAAYTASGLTASTGYQARHKVRDAAGNEATGTAVTVTTSAPWAGATDNFDDAPDGSIVGRTTQTGGLTWTQGNNIWFTLSGGEHAAPEVGSGKLVKGTATVQRSTIRRIAFDYDLTSAGGAFIRVAAGGGTPVPMVQVRATEVKAYQGSTELKSAAKSGLTGRAEVTYDGATLTVRNNGTELLSTDCPGTVGPYWGVSLGTSGLIKVDNVAVSSS